MKSGDILADFQWKRATRGYQLLNFAPGLQLMMPIPAADGSIPVQSYRLGDKSRSDLAAFAEVGKRPQDCLEFANEFGLLGFPVTVQQIKKHWLPLTPPEPNKIYDAPNETWGEFASFPQLAGLRRSLRPAEQPTRLSDHFSLDDPDVLRSWQRQSRLMYALNSSRRLGESLDDFADRWAVERSLQAAVWPTLDSQLASRLKPVSLIGAMWLHAALPGTREYKLCLSCEKTIEISRTGGARTDAIFCSGACKSRDLRQRQKQARLLALKMTPAQLAKQLRTDTATVRRWLKRG